MFVDEFTDYPFALIHVSFVSHQYFVDIIRGMLFNVPDPVPNVYMNVGPRIINMKNFKIDIPCYC